MHAFECDLAKDFIPLAPRIKKGTGVPDILHNNAVAAQGSSEKLVPQGIRVISHAPFRQ